MHTTKVPAQNGGKCPPDRVETRPCTKKQTGAYTISFSGEMLDVPSKVVVRNTIKSSLILSGADGTVESLTDISFSDCSGASCATGDNACISKCPQKVGWYTKFTNNMLDIFYNVKLTLGPLPCPENGQWAWSQWSSGCSVKTCGKATKTRIKVVKKMPKYGGGMDPPPKGLSQQLCNLPNCPVDCEGRWAPWSACPACGGDHPVNCPGSINDKICGTQLRQFRVTKHAKYGGKPCTNQAETKYCLKRFSKAGYLSLAFQNGIKAPTYPQLRASPGILSSVVDVVYGPGYEDDEQYRDSVGRLVYRSVNA